MSRITNISAYRFTQLGDLKQVRTFLLHFCKDHGLKGTILLAPEGINLFVAGPPHDIEALVGELRKLPGLDDLRPKYSESDHQPFSRMLVRLKQEIIAFGVAGVDPATYTSPRVTPRELKQWLDEGRPVVLLDTRNDYEVKLGSFTGALAAGIDHFRDFPESVKRLPAELKQAPVVTFCTGGIRCEKAAPMLEKLGFGEVYQLDGGILKYFEEVGSAHYDGECFVFDQRVGVDPGLRETGSTICYVCQTPLTGEEISDTRYVKSISCPFCYKSSSERRAEEIALRRARLAEVCSPLPGSLPYTNRKPIRIPARCDGSTLIETLKELVPHVSDAEWDSRFAAKRIVDRDGQPVLSNRRVRSGEEYVRLTPETMEPDVAIEIKIIDQDESVIVLEKPAPLPMHPCGRFNRNTLENILRLAWHPERPRPAHRLDSDTTGLVICSLTRSIATKLQSQFSAGQVKKTYLARVVGHPDEDEFSIDAAVGNQPSAGGVREVDADAGREAVTLVKVISRDAGPTSLLEVMPQTGRTNQIRLHLQHAGFPIVGDKLYCLDRTESDLDKVTEDGSTLCLHAWKITFKHPLTGDLMNYCATRPRWAEKVPRRENPD